jgi:hypothetical protein
LPEIHWPQTAQKKPLEAALKFEKRGISPPPPPFELASENDREEEKSSPGCKSFPANQRARGLNKYFG